MTEKGKVKWFNKEKGFGFIQRSNGGEDLFVHASAISDKTKSILRDHDRVEFTATQTQRGWQAEKVTVLYDKH